MSSVQKLVVAISGATGAIYGIRALEFLKRLEIETHLVISKAARITITHETEYSIKQVESLASHSYNPCDISCALASGSFKTCGMLIAPCSVKTLGAIASSIEDNAINRAAGVTLKERRRLVLMLRETPLHMGHLENMQKVSSYGAIIAPPVPAFYNHPTSLDDIISHSVSRTLDLFDIDTQLIKRWQGLFQL